MGGGFRGAREAWGDTQEGRGMDLGRGTRGQKGGGGQEWAQCPRRKDLHC